MSKSIKRLLIDASELIALTGVTVSELTAVNVYGSSCYGGTITILLQPMALARVFRELRIPRSKLKIDTDDSGNLHINFAAKGADWRCFVRHTEVAAWQDRLSHSTERITSPPTSRHIAQNRKVICLPAPPAVAASLSPAQTGQRTLFGQ